MSCTPFWSWEHTYFFFLNFLKSKNIDFIVPNHPAYHLHLGFVIMNFWPHGHTYIRPLLIHNEPFVVKSKEAISLSCHWSKSEAYDWLFANWDLSGKFCSACLCVSVAFWLCKRNIHAYCLLCTSISLTHRRKYVQETIAFYVSWNLSFCLYHTQKYTESIWQSHRAFCSHPLPLAVLIVWHLWVVSQIKSNCHILGCQILVTVCTQLSSQTLASYWLVSGWSGQVALFPRASVSSSVKGR